MTAIIIKVIGDKGSHTPVPGDCYIESYKPTPADGLGYGTLHLTKDIAKAKRFLDFTEAFQFYRQQSPTVPFRPDGKPNRPLTSMTVSFENLE